MTERATTQITGRWPRFAAAMALLTAATVLLAPAPALAQRLVASLSTDRIEIQSNFAGERMTVFGAIEGGRPGANFDAVVTLRGPRGAVTVRRKQPLGPFWFNLDNRTYIGIPSFIAVLSNRGIEQIASAEVREDLGIGIDALIPPQVTRRGANDPEFRAALQRLRLAQGLFYRNDTALRFIAPNVFQTTVILPGKVPLGKYEVDVAIFDQGALAARQTLAFEVVKTDIEQLVAHAAYERSLLYGMFAALMALLLGWLASVIFRRD